METNNFEGEQLPEPPVSIPVVGEDHPDIEDVGRISDEHKKIAQQNKDRIDLEILRSELLNKNEKVMTPEEVLIQLAEYCEPYMSAPIDAVMNGTFADPNHKLTIENGCVVLIRHASDSGHLVKLGKTASQQQMHDSSEFNAGAPDSGAIHTSAEIDNMTRQYQRYPIYGEFRIPVMDFLELGKEGKVIIGNLGESEIVISGDVAIKYLTKIIEK